MGELLHQDWKDGMRRAGHSGLKEFDDRNAWKFVVKTGFRHREASFQE